MLLAVILVEEPRAAPILLIPIGIAFVGYRSYANERQRHEKLEFLYEANRGLSQSREVAQALVGLLKCALEAYRSEQAEVILFSSESSSPLRTSLGPGEESESMTAVDSDDAAALSALLVGHARADQRRGAGVRRRSALPRVARRAARDARGAARRGPGGRPDHARQPLGFLASVHARRPGAV